jgi:PhoH-like ATPase
LKERGINIVPQCALDEIEKFQSEPGDVGDNARNASYWLSKQLEKIEYGNTINVDDSTLVFWKDNEEKSHDAKVLYTVNEVKKDKHFFNDDVVLLTKSVALRVKAKSDGILSDDYDDVGLVEEINGWRYLEVTEEELQTLSSGREEIVHLSGHDDLAKNEYVVCTYDDEICSGLVFRHIGYGDFVVVDFKPHLCGIVPKNLEQVMLANSLLDKDIPLVTTIGSAGSGKTLLAIAAAIQQVLCKHVYNKIIITRPIMPVGRDIGFLPGTVNEKMEEWIIPFKNNIEYIRDISTQKGREKVSKEKMDMLLNLNQCKDVMEVLPITYIRGSSISNAFIIVDESQNATPSEMKTIITRVGEGSKLVLTGDVDQIDNKFLSRECNGLTMAVKKFWNNAEYSHITMKNVERSELAELATRILFNQ